jgi:hypothetical protein
MERIEIEPTSTTPRIIFRPDEGYFEISGKSLPENSFEFYKPLLDFMEAYAESPGNNTSLVFKLQYFNTSSTSHFLRMIKKFEKITAEGKDAKVSWFYDLDDDDMKEAGEDFKVLSKLPIEIIGTQLD